MTTRVTADSLLVEYTIPAGVRATAESLLVEWGCEASFDGAEALTVQDIYSGDPLTLTPLPACRVSGFRFANDGATRLYVETTGDYGLTVTSQGGSLAAGYRTWVMPAGETVLEIGPFGSEYEYEPGEMWVTISAPWQLNRVQAAAFRLLDAVWTASGQQYPVGVRYAAVFALDGDGLPAASSTMAYEGVVFGGPKAFVVTMPEPRRLVHADNDRVIAVDLAPAQEGVSGELRAGVESFAVDALLASVKSFVVGESAAVVEQTNQRGAEPYVGLMFYQQSLDAVYKVRQWRCTVIPRAKCMPVPAGMGDAGEDGRYLFAATPSGRHLWGAQMTVGREGATEGQVVRMMSEYKPKLAAFLGDGVEDEFLLPTAAASTGKMRVWRNGVEVIGAMVKTISAVSFTTAPANGDVVCVWYEEAG